MPLLDDLRAQKLIHLARTRFDPALSEAELKVLRDSASSADPAKPAADAPRPEIRPEFIRWLATDPDAAKQIDPKGLRVWGITIPGKLDLEECRIAVTLDLRRCTVKGEINLLSAETRGVYLMDSLVDRRFNAARIDVRGPLFLRRTSFSGEVRLLGARIKGELDCNGAKLDAKAGNALSADGAEIDGDVFLSGEFESSGTIRLPGARITGDLDCGGAKLKVKEGYALSADRAEIGGGVYLRDGFESFGTIRLVGARITGDLDCRGAKLKVKQGKALSADRAEIGGSVFLNEFLSEKFVSSGTIRLPGARIKGDLECSGAKLKVKQGKALSADGAEIGGSVFLNDGFESSGTINLSGTRIGGNLDFLGSQVASVQCSNLHVAGDLLWIGVKPQDDTYLNLAGAKVKNLHDDKESWPAARKVNLDGLVYEELTLHKRQTEDEIVSRTFGDELPIDVQERVKWIMLQRADRQLEPQPWMQLSNSLWLKSRCVVVENAGI